MVKRGENGAKLWDIYDTYFKKWVAESPRFETKEGAENWIVAHWLKLDDATPIYLGNYTYSDIVKKTHYEVRRIPEEI